VVAAAFADEGALASALPGFEPREGQRRMAAAVSETLEQGGVLLSEAGTGTGKTLAYLVPAILSRRRVLISTGTKNLQEQIFFKDLPLLRGALGVPFTATCMKGRANFLCLHRFDSFAASQVARPPADAYYIDVLKHWAAVTGTGDRAEVEELPDDLHFWNEIAATSENCLGTECPRYNDCFVTRMRQRAAESDVVIVNHHLLCADASVRQSAYGEVIPECHYAIIDEAHQLEDVATQYFGISLSNYRIDELVRDGSRLLSAKGDRDVADDLRPVLGRIEERSRSFFSALGANGRAAAGADDRLRLTADALEPVADDGYLLRTALEALEGSIALLKEPGEDLLALLRRAGDIRHDLSMLLRASDLDYVYYLELRGRGVFLKASPIDVSRIVRELLLDHMEATVLTSATLAVDDSFAYVKGRLGIRDAAEIRLASEFDYTRQAILYLPSRMPEPRSPRFAEAAAREVIEILKRTEGRAFVLFTSYAMLRAVHALTATALDYPLFVQGTAPRSALLRDVRATPHAVLLATSSFWHGLDVIGEALSCVIVDKLPFASPGDPITAARVEAIASRGGEPFDEYQVPLAILSLLQGLGRLIRHRLDRGVLAILDPRVRTKGYGRRFLQALPNAPVTQDLRAVERFFASPPRG
jgi:ATP-dependent DNA helicase DinG